MRSSKKNVVLDVANIDGGAHVDPNIPLRHAAASEPLFQFGVNENFVRPNLARVTVAQAGHELLDYIVRLCFGMLVRLVRRRQSLLLENLALRQQLVMLKRRKPPAISADAVLWGSTIRPATAQIPLWLAVEFEMLRCDPARNPKTTHPRSNDDRAVFTI